MPLLLLMSLAVAAGLALVVVTRRESPRTVGLALIAAVLGYLGGSSVTIGFVEGVGSHTAYTAWLSALGGAAGVLTAAGLVILIRPFAQPTRDDEFARLDALIAAGRPEAAGEPEKRSTP